MSKPLAFFQDLARQKYQREVVFVAQVGSLNYNLQTEDSDEDYEVYLLPTFNSYYNRQEVSADTHVDGVDVKFKEVGLLANQLVKSNPNFLQLLFSKMSFTAHPNSFGCSSNEKNWPLQTPHVSMIRFLAWPRTGSPASSGHAKKMY